MAATMTTSHEHHCTCGHAYVCSGPHPWARRCPRCSAEMAEVAVGTPRPPLVKRPVTPQIVPSR